MSRLLNTIRSIVRETFPRYDYLGPRKYRVVRMIANRLDLQIVNRATGLPDLLPIAMWPGLAGTWAKMTPGAEVLVQFIDGDPSQPIVTHYTPKGDAGFVPVEVEIDATDKVTIGHSADLVEVGSGTEIPPPIDPTGRVIRYGDTIAIPGVGDYVLVPGSVPAGVSRVKA